MSKRGPPANGSAAKRMKAMSEASDDLELPDVPNDFKEEQASKKSKLPPLNESQKRGNVTIISSASKF